jgi:tetratricopeptide (TPR) repeat protein
MTDLRSSALPEAVPSPQEIFKRAVELRKQGKLNQAAALARDVIVSAPTMLRADAAIFMARLYQEQDDLQRAEQACEWVLHLGNKIQNDVRAYAALRLGEIRELMLKLDGADRAYEQAAFLRLRDGGAEAHRAAVKLAMLRNERGHHAAAVAAARGTIGIEDEELSGQASFWSAEANRLRGNRVAAIELYEVCARLNNIHRISALYQWALLLIDEKSWESAERILQELAKDPDAKMDPLRDAVLRLVARMGMEKGRHDRLAQHVATTSTQVPSEHSPSPAASSLDAGNRRQQLLDDAYRECLLRAKTEDFVERRYWEDRARAIRETGRLDALPQDVRRPRAPRQDSGASIVSAAGRAWASSPKR